MEKKTDMQPLDLWAGKVLESYKDIEASFLAFDKEGERLFVKGEKGDIIEIIGGEDSPLQPIVKYELWVDFGKDSERTVAKNVGASDFLALKPQVIDVEKELSR